MKGNMAVKEEIAFIYEQAQRIREILAELKTEAEYLDKFYKEKNGKDN